MLNISRNPYLRLKEKLKRVAGRDISEGKDLFEVENEVFIALCEDIPEKDIVGIIDEQIISERIRRDLKEYLRIIVAKGVNRYDRRRCKENNANCRKKAHSCFSEIWEKHSR